MRQKNDKILLAADLWSALLLNRQKEVSMFGTVHILYMLISGIVGAAILVGLYLWKNDRANVLALRFLAIITVIIHYSPLWVDFFTTGSATVSSVMLLPIHPCNVCMWLLLISSCITERNGVVARIIKEFTFWGGTVCGAIGTILNENFGSNPTLADYDVLKGLLSHSTMVFGCILLFTAGFVKIRVFSNLISITSGLVFFLVDGFIINTLYAIFGLDPCNSMYLIEAPFPDIPWLITPVMGLMAVVVAFSVSAIFEAFALPNEERWYSKLKNFINSKKETLK